MNDQSSEERSSSALAQIWVDQGGTCQDRIELHCDGSLVVRKLFSKESTSSNVPIRKGTTVATNALLERRSCKILMITNQGLGDLLWIGDQRRASLFDSFGHRISLIDAEVLEWESRIDAQGNVLYHRMMERTDIEPFLKLGVEAIAIVFVHSHVNESTEKDIAQKCQSWGIQYVSMGHRIAKERGFVDRMRSTAIDAALNPILPREKALYMRSDGGLAAHDTEEWSGVHAVLSGPAGGARAVATLADSLGIKKAFGLDMGGTSADVCHVTGRLRTRDSLPFEGWNIRVPTIDIETVAAGGGSVLRVVDGVAFVGPQSAGSDPGPACYGRGGPASLCDCSVVLGLLPLFPNVCGAQRTLPLDMAASHAAISQLLSPEEQDVEFAVEHLAEQFQELAAEQMSNAILRMSATRGVDPEEHVLIAFGGAGPAHACRVAERLGMKRIVVPFLASVFSAYGIGLAPRRMTRMEPIVHGGVKEALVRIHVYEDPVWDFERVYSIRASYEGTDGVIELKWSQGMDTEAYFHRMHEEQFGFSRRGHRVLLHLLIRYDEERLEKTNYSLKEKCIPHRRIHVFLDGCNRSVALIGAEAVYEERGPILVALEGSMLLVREGWKIFRKEESFVLEQEDRSTKNREVFSSIQTAIFSGRVASVAERMGGRLVRLARSVSIRERKDFSCAIFDVQGRLIANAPHVPVHLGSMGVQLRHFLSNHSMQHGEVWIGNDPYAGGAHLPDITAFCPVFINDLAVAYVGCRGHHIEIGGIQPGSMPPYSRHIDEEGIRIEQHYLYSKEEGFLWPDITQSRRPEDLIADLEAQVASCLYGVELVMDLAKEGGLQKGFHLMFMHARSASLRWMRDRVGSYCAEEILDNGLCINISMKITEEEGFLRVDAPADDGNLNAPHAVLRACLLYVIRCTMLEEIPLNAGFLDCWDIKVNEGGLFDPHYPRAVVGGNVETSQRVVDALLMAMGVQAGSQGTMNNICISCGGEVLYETLGGGAGAGADCDGGSAVQVHMTNTQATDVEDLENRMPIRVTEWSIRHNSGGVGKKKGGAGMTKEWLFLEDAEVSLLASRRFVGASGCSGGGMGVPGEDRYTEDGVWFDMSGHVLIKGGEKCRISTPGGGGFGERTLYKEPKSSL
jgi:5-oxoprolinase (ATP-hydrolysing)